MATPHDLVEAVNAQAHEQGWPARVDPTLAFESPALAFFVQTWRDHLHGRTMPSRSDLSARTMRNHLGRLMLFERVEGPTGRRYRVRLMGTGLNQVWGDMTGKFIDEVIPERLLPRWHAFIELVLAAGAPLRFTARVDFQGKDFLVAELGGVPLTDDAGEPTMVMAALHTSGEKPWDQVIATYDGVKPRPQWRFRMNG